MVTDDELDWRLITLDFDNRNDPEVKKNVRNALETLIEPQIRISPSGMGFHVRGWAYCNDPIEVRKSLGDDPERIRFDEQVQGRPKGILWDVKIINGKVMRASKWFNPKKIKTRVGSI